MHLESFGSSKSGGWKFALSRSHICSCVFSSPSSAWSLELLCGSPLQPVMRFVVWILDNRVKTLQAGSGSKASKKWDSESTDMTGIARFQNRGSSSVLNRSVSMVCVWDHIWSGLGMIACRISFTCHEMCTSANDLPNPSVRVNQRFILVPSLNRVPRIVWAN